MQTLSGLMRLLEQGEGPRPAKCRNLPRLQLQVLPALTQGCSLSWTWERGIALLQAGGASYHWGRSSWGPFRAKVS